MAKCWCCGEEDATTKRKYKLSRRDVKVKTHMSYEEKIYEKIVEVPLCSKCNDVLEKKSNYSAVFAGLFAIAGYIIIQIFGWRYNWGQTTGGNIFLVCFFLGIGGAGLIGFIGSLVGKIAYFIFGAKDMHRIQHEISEYPEIARALKEEGYDYYMEN